MMVRRALAAVVVAGLALLAGACGSSGGNPYGRATPTTALVQLWTSLAIVPAPIGPI